MGLMLESDQILLTFLLLSEYSCISSEYFVRPAGAGSSPRGSHRNFDLRRAHNIQGIGTYCDEQSTAVGGACDDGAVLQRRHNAPPSRGLRHPQWVSRGTHGTHTKTALGYFGRSYQEMTSCDLRLWWRRRLLMVYRRRCGRWKGRLVACSDSLYYSHCSTTTNAPVV